MSAELECTFVLLEVRERQARTEGSFYKARCEKKKYKKKMFKVVL